VNIDKHTESNQTLELSRESPFNEVLLAIETIGAGMGPLFVQIQTHMKEMTCSFGKHNLQI
jgi:hypothetical protein